MTEITDDIPVHNSLEGSWTRMTTFDGYICSLVNVSLRTRVNAKQ